MATDLETGEALLRKMVGSVDEMSDSLLEAQKRFTGFAGSFAEMSSASNKHWTFISRILSGSGLWRVQNRVRALGNFFEILKMSEDKAIEGQKEAIKNFAIVQKNVDQYDKMLNEINAVLEGNLDLSKADSIAQADIFKYYKAQYGEAKALEKLKEQIQNAEEKNFQALRQLSKDNIDSTTDGFQGLQSEIERVRMIEAQGFATRSKEMNDTFNNYENQIKQQEKMLEEQTKLEAHQKMMVHGETLHLEALEKQVAAYTNKINLTRDEYDAYIKLDTAYKKQQQDTEKAKREELRLSMMINNIENQTASLKADMESSVTAERQGMAKKAKIKGGIAKAVPFSGPLMKYLHREKPLQKIQQKLAIENYKKLGKTEKARAIVTKMFDIIPFDPITKFIKFGLKIFKKLFFVMIYWSLMFALIVAAVAGLYEAGVFDTIYQAYLAIKEGFIANKEIFVAVWTAISAFFGSLFALISMSQSGTAAEIEAQKQDVMQKFSNMITAAIIGLVTLLVLILPVVVETFVMMIPVLIEAAQIMIESFFVLIPVILTAIVEGFQTYLDNKFPEAEGALGTQLGLAVEAIATWFMDDVYTGKAKPWIDGIVSWFAIKWGFLLLVQGMNAASNMTAATGIMAVVWPVLAFVALFIGVAAIFIALRGWLMKFLGDKVGRIVSTILAMLAIGLLIAFFIGGGWIIALGVALMGILLWFWDSIWGAISGLFSFFETGGTVTKDNMQIVGEGGPELVKLPVGSTVYPNEVFRMGSTTKSVNQANLTFNINVNGRVGASDSEIRDIAKKLGTQIEKEVKRHVKNTFGA